VRRYRFSLESVLRARRAQEELARQRVAEANQHVNAARTAYVAALDAYRALAVPTGPVDRPDLVAQRDHQTRMLLAVERAHGRVAEAEVAAATCYAAWVETAKAVASLERLDERRRAEWEAEARRDEAAAVDDVVVSRYNSPVESRLGAEVGL
jgi:flagellar export protein FliJ